MPMAASSITIFPEGEKDAISASTKTCGICLDAASKYTCPRCNVCYCSLGCFKALNHAGCSESFYKDCLVEDMKNNRASDEEKQRILNMLKEFEEGVGREEDDAEEEVSLEERIRDVDLDNVDDIWDVLTAGEREEFEKTMQSGSLVIEWKPWWLYHDTSLLKEIGEGVQDRVPSEAKSIPPHRVEVSELPILLRGREPSPLIRNNLLDVLYCYVYHCHKYNGTIYEFACEASRDIIYASPFLKLGITVNTAEEAIQGTMERCSEMETGGGRRLLLEVILDVYHILLGRDEDNLDLYVQSAISELHSCCEVFKRHLKKHAEKGINTKDVLKILKKLEFILSWSQSHRLQLLSLALDVMGVYKDKMKFMEEHEETKQAVERSGLNSNPKNFGPLIQEIA